MNHVEEIERCKCDFVYWVEKYARIPMIDQTNGKPKLFGGQRVIAIAMCSLDGSDVGIDTRQNRQKGTSTIVNLHTLWLALFGGVLSIKVISTNERREIHVLKNAIYPFDFLPKWMQDHNKIIRRNKNGVWFENGSSMTIKPEWMLNTPTLIHFDLFDFMPRSKKQRVYEWMKSEMKPSRVNFICTETGMPFVNIVKTDDLLKMLVES